MKQIWQSTKKHASGAFDIAKDLAGLKPRTYLEAIFPFPFPDSREKSVPIGSAMNRGYLKEDFSQLAGIGGLGRGPAPGQSLSLDMDQASLHCDTRPQLAQDVDHVRVTVNRKATRLQAVLYKRLKKCHKLWFGVLRDRVFTRDNLVLLSIHQGNEAAWAVQESAVQDKVLVLIQAQQWLRRRLFKIVVNHTVQLCRAMPTLMRQLPDRITFSHPEPEPLPLPGTPCRWITPDNGLPARRTKPALLSISIMTISLQSS